MELGLQMLLKRHALSMEDKMAAGAFGRATNYDETSPVRRCLLMNIIPFSVCHTVVTN